MTKDEVEAVRWYRKSAELGNAAAQSSLGMMYADGVGVVKNEMEAVKWYRKAIEQEDAWGMNNYAWLLLTTTNESLHNDQMALEYAQKAIAKTESDHWNKLGTLALALFQNGKIPEAIATEKKAISLLPETMPENERKQFQDQLHKFEAVKK